MPLLRAARRTVVPRATTTDLPSIERFTVWRGAVGGCPTLRFVLIGLSRPAPDRATVLRRIPPDSACRGYAPRTPRGTGSSRRRPALARPDRGHIAWFAPSGVPARPGPRGRRAALCPGSCD